MQKHIYSNGNLQEMVYFYQNNSASAMKLKKIINIFYMLTAETQALNLKSSGGNFQVLPFSHEKSSLI